MSILVILFDIVFVFMVAGSYVFLPAPPTPYIYKVGATIIQTLLLIKRLLLS
jgi:hypothetical protein